MIATMSQQAPTMTFPMSHSSAPKRPKLSLQIKSSAMIALKPGTALTAEIDPTSATAFNTLSNAYAAAIELSSPKVAVPPASSDSMKSINPARKSGLRLITSAASAKSMIFPSQQTQTPGPFSMSYPDTANSAHNGASPISAYPRTDIPSFTFTPPQSAHPSDESKPHLFSFPSRHSDDAAAISPRCLRKYAPMGTQYLPVPYTHPRSLHSILRNSPLPPKSEPTLVSPTHPSCHAADRAAKKLCFNSPLTQTITTEMYIKSHIDLLAEEASPHSATESEARGLETLDLTMAYTGDETRDGGQTPGPFEEMRRRMAGLEAESEVESPGCKKRKRKEKKRRWVWTIGVNEDEVEDKQPSPVACSSSEQPESSSLVETTVAETQAEDYQQTTTSKTELPSEVSAEGSDTANPAAGAHLPSEDVGETRITTMDRQPDSPKIPITSIEQWAEVPKYSSVIVSVKTETESLARPELIMVSAGDIEAAFSLEASPGT